MKRRGFFAALLAPAAAVAQSTSITGRQIRPGISARFSKGEIPGGTPNGNNASFTIANTPVAPTGVLLFVNGLLQNQGAGFDYTLVGQAITFTAQSIPQAGDELFVAPYQF